MSRQLAIGIVIGFIVAVAALAMLEGRQDAAPTATPADAPQPAAPGLRPLPVRPQIPLRPRPAFPPSRDQLRGVPTEAVGAGEETIPRAVQQEPRMVPALQPADGGTP